MWRYYIMKSLLSKKNGKMLKTTQNNKKNKKKIKKPVLPKICLLYRYNRFDIYFEMTISIIVKTCKILSTV